MNAHVLPDRRAQAVAVRLTALFAAAVLAVLVAANLAAVLVWQRLDAGTPVTPALLALPSAIVLLVIGGATWAELRRLGSFEGVEEVEIDFAVAWRDLAAQSDWFPPELLWRAGALDIALRVSHYLTQERES